MCVLVETEERKETASWYEALYQMFSTGTMESKHTLSKIRELI